MDPRYAWKTLILVIHAFLLILVFVLLGYNGSIRFTPSADPDVLLATHGLERCRCPAGGCVPPQMDSTGKLMVGGVHHAVGSAQGTPLWPVRRLDNETDSSVCIGTTSVGLEGSGIPFVVHPPSLALVVVFVAMSHQIFILPIDKQGGEQSRHASRIILSAAVWNILSVLILYMTASLFHTPASTAIYGTIVLCTVTLLQVLWWREVRPPPCACHDWRCAYD